MGSNAAEHHPICFKWVLKAREERGAAIIHVDPKFSRTSARSDFHVPLRSGTDIAFLGGMIKYIIENNKHFKEECTTKRISHYIVRKKDIYPGIPVQARFYAYCIFKNEQHPYPRRINLIRSRRWHTLNSCYV